MIPKFNQKGNLPPGIHKATLAEVQKRFGWTPYRRELLKGLRRVLRQLVQAGCVCFYLDGSFVTSKVIPGDYDGIWVCDGVELDKVPPLLRAIDSNGMPLSDMQKWKAAMRRKYKGEVFPMDSTQVGPGTFLSLFQKDKSTDEPKGIIEIDLRGLEL
jgi:hypothetical protein